MKRLDNQKTETYIGLTPKTFKQKWSNHKTSFRLIIHSSETKLSTYIWDLKKQGINFELNWRIVAKTNSYSPSSKKILVMCQRVGLHNFSAKKSHFKKETWISPLAPTSQCSCCANKVKQSKFTFKFLVYNW